MSDLVHGHQTDYVGILQETTYKTNPIPDFTVPSTFCNPIFTNEDNGPNATTDKLDEAVNKTLNSRHLAALTDNKNGRTAYTLTMGGNLKDGGLGYVLQTANQVVSFDSTDMVYKLEEEDDTCRTNSYHIYVPRSCSATKKAFIVGGCEITTLEIDHKTQIWTATFDCATKDEEPSATEIPGQGNYRDIATIDQSNYPETFGQLVIDGDIQETTSLTQTITFTKADNLGQYGADGKRTGFTVINVGCEIDFTLPYSDTVETSNKSKTYWIGADGETQTGSFGISNISSVSASFVLSCYGALTGVVRDTPGNELWSFTGKIMVQQEKEDALKDYQIVHKDALGDISTNF
jgi:hypothetical protein